MIEIVTPGLTTMLQGQPYRGQRHAGMPLSGAADPLSLSLANWLTGNRAEISAIETAYAPFAFRAASPMMLGVQGAARDIWVNDKPHDAQSSIAAKAGDLVSLSAATSGCRSYIAVAGGFAAEEMLGGNSTYLPAGIGGSAHIEMKAGTLLQRIADGNAATKPRWIPQDLRWTPGSSFILRFVAGPEYEWMDTVSRARLTGQPWQVGRRADRIGLQLKGHSLKMTETKIVQTRSLDSSAVFPGCLQCPPSGEPFLLAPDAQTTGGYPRIAQIIRADRHLIGQLRPGATVRLQRIEAAEARPLYGAKLAMLRKLQPDMRLD